MSNKYSKRILIKYKQFMNKIKTKKKEEGINSSRILIVLRRKNKSK
jgi:hypothetical protein